MHTFEVEVKVLLGKKYNADQLVLALRGRDPGCALMKTSSQLNHYFNEAGDFVKLQELLQPLVSKEQRKTLSQVLLVGKKHSLRTRDADGIVILVVKADKQAAADSMHGTMRYEWEAVIQEMTIDQLDELIRSCGFEFLSKWSRERQEYRYKEMNVCIDKNAGYGYLAEFEKVVQGEEHTDAAKAVITEELVDLGLAEVSPQRLGRMFAYYNAHWPEYYRTEKTFIVE